MNIPRPMNHIGISVPDIAAATTWYQDVLGCTLLQPPVKASNDGSQFGECLKDIFGGEFESVLMAHLVTANGTGIELFQFIQPKTIVPKNTFEYWRGGIFHFCITASDIEEMVEKIRSNNGKILSKIWKFYSNKDYRVVYCQDPWGNIIELASQSYEQFWSNIEQPKPIK